MRNSKFLRPDNPSCLPSNLEFFREWDWPSILQSSFRADILILNIPQLHSEAALCPISLSLGNSKVILNSLLRPWNLSVICGGGGNGRINHHGCISEVWQGYWGLSLSYLILEYSPFKSRDNLSVSPKNGFSSVIFMASSFKWFPICYSKLKMLRNDYNSKENVTHT